MLGPSPWMARFPFGRLQVNDPTGANYASATCSGGSITVSTVQHPVGEEVLLWVKAASHLPAGAAIVIKLGDTSQGGPGASFSFTPGRLHVCVLEDRTGSGSYTLSPAHAPLLLVTAERADGFLVSAPLDPQVDVPFRFSVRAMQGHDVLGDAGYLPAETYEGRVRFSCSDPRADLPAETTFRREDRGVRQFTATLHTRGIHTLFVEEAGKGIGRTPGPTGLSNTMEVVAADADLQTLCGDLQRHAAEGGHAAMTDRYVWRQLYEDRDDFATVVEHSGCVMSGFINANQVARAFQDEVDPGESEFVCFPGYEWTLAGAHRHVIYRTFTTDLSVTHRTWRGTESPGPTVKTTTGDLLDWLATMPSDADHIAIPHHSLWVGIEDRAPDQLYDWGPDLESSLQPVVEITSGHGSSEKWLAAVTHPWDYPIGGDLVHQRNQSNRAGVQDALVQGYRFGFVGGSDHHSYGTHTAGIQEDSRTGITFVLAKRSDGALRDRIWSGILARRTYATTGARILLSWGTTSGLRMGSEGFQAVPTFRLQAHASTMGGTARPRFLLVEVVRDDTTVDSESVDTSDLTDWSWSDPAPLLDHHAHAYYVKVVQDDFHVAWASPVFLRSN
jgi:hypothetical protein